MKKLFPTSPLRWIGLAVLLTTLFATPVSYGLAQDTGTKVFIDPPTREIVLGETRKVRIEVEEVTGLFRAEVHLAFDPKLLEVVDADADTAGVQIEPGDFLSPDSIAKNNVDQATGRIEFAVAQMPPREPANGSGILARVDFRGKAAGTSALIFWNAQPAPSVILSDRDGKAISTSIQDGTVIVTVGEGPTPTPTPTSTPGPPAARTHIVRPGEWLYCIARAYSVDPKAIAEENRIVNPNLIYPEQELKIPDKPGWWLFGTACQRQFDGGTPPATCRLHHTVALGETLYSISVRYGVSMWAIAEANHILNLNYIRAGHVLCIP
jgi:LysM repeat protein